ncbi:hypothetical protein Tco_1219535 [Tanacetum coccineum]
MAKAKENALSVEIQIISSENVQNYQDIKIKKRLLEDLGVIATKMKRRRQMTKSVLWLKLQMRKTIVLDLGLGTPQTRRDQGRQNYPNSHNKESFYSTSFTQWEVVPHVCDKMPKATTTDISLTKSYIPKVSKIPGISPTIAQFYKPIENRNIHEGRVVDQAYYKSNNIERLFTNIRFNCLFQINEPIVPRFILDFYSQVTVQTDEYGYLVISFMIQHEFITLTLAQFGQILKIPYNGQAVFTNEWDLASLEYSRETEGPYCTDLPTPDDIRRLLELERVMVDRTIKSQTVSLNPNQILTKELSPDMKQWEELIRENVFGLGGHRDHLPACLAHMLYCVVAEEQYNLAYFFVKRIQCARATPTANLPYGMFLTRLYRYVMETYPHLDNGIYDIVDQVMRPLGLKQT